MRLIVVLVYVITSLISYPASAAQKTKCSIERKSPLPSLTYDFSKQVEQDFTSFILNYLNAGGSVGNLQTAIEANSKDDLPYPDNQPLIRATVAQQDITGDSNQDVLVDIDIAWGPTYQNMLSLFNCSGSQYSLLDSLEFGNFYDLSFAPGASVVKIVDMNGNKRPEIVMRVGLVQQKMLDAIMFYEWDGSKLKQTYTTDFSLGRSGKLEFKNVDDNPDTTELLLDESYGYGQSTADAVIEIWYWRSIVQIYAWNGKEYALFCQHFSDNPPSLFETLQSAETYRACGYYAEAKRFYERMINNPRLERWPNLEAFGNGNDEKSREMMKLEESYLIPFAYYRLIQIALHATDLNQAKRLYRQVESKYPLGKHGYQYVAMSGALLKEFEKSEDLEKSCIAAQTAFDNARKNGEDPGIPYESNDENDPNYTFYRFYWYSGSNVFSPDPDNIFKVPGYIADIVSIPVCLKG